MKNKFNIIFTVIIMFCITGNSNSVNSSNNPPSSSFYFALNHNSVIEELTSTIKEFDKATNSNIIDMVQNTTNELENIYEYTNNNSDDLINQMTKYTKVIKTLFKTFKQVKRNFNEYVQNKMNNSIIECLLSCKNILTVINSKPVIQSSAKYTSILDVLKIKKKPQNI